MQAAKDKKDVIHSSSLRSFTFIENFSSDLHRCTPGLFTWGVCLASITLILSFPVQRPLLALHKTNSKFLGLVDIWHQSMLPNISSLVLVHREKLSPTSPQFQSQCISPFLHNPGLPQVSSPFPVPVGLNPILKARSGAMPYPIIQATVPAAAVTHKALCVHHLFLILYWF